MVATSYAQSTSSTVFGLEYMGWAWRIRLKDMTFVEKLPKYLEQNILTKTLCSQFYENNPKLRKFIDQEGINLTSFDSFSKESIKKRNQVYKEVANKIWSIDNLK